ncbi:hypothetical protein DOY81_000237, partial [Sarcophaga bullata]
DNLDIYFEEPTTYGNNMLTRNTLEAENRMANEEDDIIYETINRNTILSELQLLKKQFKQSTEENKKILNDFTKEIQTLKNELSEFSENASKTLKFTLPTLPFTSQLEYMEYEKKLSIDHDTKMNLRYFIKTLLANDYRAFVKKAIKTFIPDELAIHFSWRGTNSKPSVQTFTLISIIKDTTLSKFIDCSEKQINRIIQQHFLHANDRLKKKQKSSTL